MTRSGRDALPCQCLSSSLKRVDERAARPHLAQTVYLERQRCYTERALDESRCGGRVLRDDADRFVGKPLRLECLESSFCPRHILKYANREQTARCFNHLVSFVLAPAMCQVRPAWRLFAQAFHAPFQPYP